ncbi:MAG: radical SAM protein, partial [Paenibacillaceae bacterium]
MSGSIRLPMVEIFETVEGEGTQAGFPTIFVRLFGCNLRCVW